MAKIIKFPISHSEGIPQSGHFQFSNKARSWLEDKSKRVRKMWQPQASRFAGIKRSQRKVRALRGVRIIVPFIIPLGLGLIILFLAISLSLPKDEFQKAKERLAKNSADFEAHLILAEKYLNNHQLPEAEKELLLAEKIESAGQLDNLTASLQNKNVLGASASKLEQLWQREKENNPQEIKYLIDQWEKIIVFRPDYRDGYLQLAVLNYKISENQKAKEFLQKALELDPNFEPTKELGKIIQ